MELEEVGFKPGVKRRKSGKILAKVERIRNNAINRAYYTRRFVTFVRRILIYLLTYCSADTTETRNLSHITSAVTGFIYAHAMRRPNRLETRLLRTRPS